MNKLKYINTNENIYDDISNIPFSIVKIVFDKNNFPINLSIKYSNSFFNNLFNYNDFSTIGLSFNSLGIVLDNIIFEYLSSILLNSNISNQIIKLEINSSIYRINAFKIDNYDIGIFFTEEEKTKENICDNNKILLVTKNDITKNKQIEKELQEVNALYCNLYKIAPISIICFNAQGIIEFISDFYINKYSTNKNDITLFIGKSITEISCFVNANISSDLQDLIDGKSIELCSVLIPNLLNNKSVYVNLRGVPLLKNNKIIGGIIIQEDITERIIAEEELKKLVKILKISQKITKERNEEITILNSKLKYSESKLRESIDNKDKFLSVVSHDIKNPLQGILGISSILKNDYNIITKNEAISFYNDLYNTASQLNYLLENLLHWSKLQRDLIKNNPEIFSLKQIVDLNIDLMKANATQKNITIINSVSYTFNVYADINIVNTILRNTLSNAIKFTNQGGSINITAEYYNQEYIKIAVKDNGKGMSQEEINKIFNFDTYYSTPGTNNERGTGLGIILCKDLIDKSTIGDKKCSIWIESEVGNGTTIYFTLLSSN